MVAGSLQVKKGNYYVVLSYNDKEGKKKLKWVSTGLNLKAGKKVLNDKLYEIKKNFEEEQKNIESSKEITTNKIHFADFMKNWLQILKPSIELTTYTSYKQMFDARIYPYFKERNFNNNNLKEKGIYLDELRPIHIQEYYSEMLSLGLKGNTVIHYHAMIRKCLDFAFKMDLISCNLADKVQRPKKEMFIGSFYSIDEVNALFKAIKDDPLEITILLATFYGLRRSEVLGIKWDAIDFKNKTITIKHTINEIREDGKSKIIGKDRTKNKSSYRTLPLVDEIAVKLKQLKAQQNQNRKKYKKSYNTEYSEYVCVDKMGNIIKPGYVTQHFRIVLANNNLRHIRFHDLRHSCASLLLARGVSITEIQEWLGHSCIQTTMIYAHLDSSSKQNSANTLSGIFNIKENTPTSAKVDASKQKCA